MGLSKKPLDDRSIRILEGSVLAGTLALVNIFLPLVGTTALFFFGLWVGLAGAFPAVRISIAVREVMRERQAKRQTENNKYSYSVWRRP